MTALILRVLLVGAAGYRLARLVSVDSITDGPRRWLYDRARVCGYDEDGDEIRGGVWAWFYRLVSCPHCVGLWLTAGLFAAWSEWDWSHWPVAALACAGVQSFLSAHDSG